MRVTAEQVKSAALAAGIEKVPHHECSICGFMVAYYIRDGDLFFDSGCNCVYDRDSFRPEPWQRAADWINMQTKEEHAQRIAGLFGLAVPAQT